MSLKLGKLYNHQKDVLDGTEHKFSIEHDYTTLPIAFDLRTIRLPPILDQLSIGSCGANQISNILRYCLQKEKFNDFQPSRLFIYYFTRLIEGSMVTEDT